MERFRSLQDPKEKMIRKKFVNRKLIESYRGYGIEEESGAKETIRCSQRKQFG